VGTTSPRRRVQVLAERDDLTVVPLSGTVDARLGKLKEGEAEAIVMAAAGLKRLQIEKVISQYLPVDRFVPSPGQGALAVEVRHEEGPLPGIVQKVCHDVPTALAVRAERNFLRRAGGDSETPLGAHATLDGAGLTLRGFLATPEGTKSVNEEITGAAEDAADLGKRLADQLIAKLEGRSVGRRV
jgi:hydroxymethylbilane synthase